MILVRKDFRALPDRKDQQGQLARYRPGFDRSYRATRHRRANRRTRATGHTGEITARPARSHLGQGAYRTHRPARPTGLDRRYRREGRQGQPARPAHRDRKDRPALTPPEQGSTSAAIPSVRWTIQRPTKEQTLSLSGTTLSLSNGGGSANLSSLGSKWTQGTGNAVYRRMAR